MRPLPSGLHFLQAQSERFPASANMVAVDGDEGLTLFDAGGSGAENHRTTTEALAALGKKPGDVTAVFLTHAHADHSGGLSLLRAHRPGVRVALHPGANAMLPSKAAYFSTFDFDLIRTKYPDPKHPGRERLAMLEQFLAEGDCPFEPFTPTETLGPTVRLGALTFDVIESVGHAPGHVMFHLAEAKLLIAGDLVGQQLAWHSPSSGGASAYLDALERAAALGVTTVLPAHGAAVDDGLALISKLRDKMLKREDKLMSAMKNGSRTWGELLLAMIGAASEDDVGLFPAAPMLEGHLQRLQALGRLRRDGGPAAHDERVSAIV